MTLHKQQPDMDIEKWHNFTRNDQVILSLLAIIIGVCVGYGTIGFRFLLGHVQGLLYGSSSQHLASVASNLEWWQILLAPAAGGLFVGLFLQFVMPGKKAESVAQVIEAGALRGGNIPIGRGVGAAIVSAISLGSGASAGREGPVVHLGATAASCVARRFGFGPSLTLTLLGCGVASAVAGSFNAPIAGVFFALEVVIGHYALHAFAPIVLASVAGTTVSRFHLGDFPAFILPEYSISSLFEIPAFLLLGVICAFIAIIFIRSILYTEDFVKGTKTPIWVRPVLGGLCVGAIAIVFPQALGVGYEATDDALKGLIPLALIITLIIAKIMATSITLGSGFGGGVFSPSLYIGAMTGGAFGIIIAAANPDLTSSPGLYAIVGMGAVAAPVLGAPISTVLMMFELLGDFSLTIAAMITVAVSSIVTHQMLGASFFSLQLSRRGVSLKGGRARQILLSLKVRQIMEQDFQTVTDSTSIAELRHLMKTAPHDHFFVVNAKQHYVGKLGFADIRDIAFDVDIDPLVNCGDAARLVAPITGSDDLEQALLLIESTGQSYLPVIDNQEKQKIIGILHYNQVLREYNRALLSVHAEEHDNR